MCTVTLYTKDGCHLCEDALAVIERVRRDVAFDLRRCDITCDERTHRAYFDRIPVIEVDGVEAFQYTVSEAGLRETLARAAPNRDGPGRTAPPNR